MEVCVYRLIEIARDGILDMVRIQEARLEEEKKQTQILQQIADKLTDRKEYSWQELRNRISITLDSSYEQYCRDHDEEKWKKESAKAIYYIQLYRDENWEEEIDDMVYHATDFNPLSHKNNYDQAVGMAIKQLRCLLKEEE